MLRVVSWKWRPPNGVYRSQFGAEHVNTLKRMVARHYARPHEFICITDDAAGIDPDIRIIPLWDDFNAVPSPHGPSHPSCYRRLKVFSGQAKELIGERFVSIDLDCVIVRDVAPVFDRPDDFVIWKRMPHHKYAGQNRPIDYNGSMFLMTAGARPQVWNDFHPIRSPQLTKQRGFIGSDQGWLSLCLGPNEKTWTAADGVYSYPKEIEPQQGRLPDNARIVFFPGRVDPWSTKAQALQWVREHYR